MAVKDKVLKRDNNCCVVCGFNATINRKGVSRGILELAHVWPNSELGGGLENNLISLCPNCHTLFDQQGAFYFNIETGEVILHDLNIDVKVWLKNFNKNHIIKYILKGNLKRRQDYSLEKQETK